MLTLQRNLISRVLTWLPEMNRLPRVPDLTAQREAMKRLSFLVGKWAGEARLLHGSAEPVELFQTEEAQYKLGGLLVMVEGIGRAKSDGQVLLHALAIISYDDEAGIYRLRAFNDGRFLETQMKLLEAGEGITWAFALGEVRTSSVLRINDHGEWTESAEVSLGSQPPRKLLELTVHPQK